MPDTPIDLSEGIQSVRLKVPTATVPIPPEGFAQLHSPALGELALRLPDGSVVAIGGGGGGGGAATSVLGPGGAIDAANSDPRIGININAVPGTGIGFTGRFLDQFAKPLGVQVEPVVVSSAELLALHTTPKVLVAAPGVGQVIWPAAYFVFYIPGSVGYNIDATIAIGPASDPVANSWDILGAGNLSANTLAAIVTRVSTQPVVSLETSAATGQALHAKASVPWTDGDGALLVLVSYLVV